MCFEWRGGAPIIWGVDDCLFKWPWPFGIEKSQPNGVLVHGDEVGRGIRKLGRGKLGRGKLGRRKLRRGNVGRGRLEGEGKGKEKSAWVVVAMQ